jgi:hypothetical protein
VGRVLEPGPLHRLLGLLLLLRMLLLALALLLLLLLLLLLRCAPRGAQRRESGCGSRPALGRGSRAQGPRAALRRALEEQWRSICRGEQGLREREYGR